MYFEYLDSPIGTLEIIADNHAIISIGKVSSEPKSNITKANTALELAKLQLTEYFAGSRKSFTIPINNNGAGFNHLTWQFLLQIPYGSVMSYKQVAEKIGNPKAARAVGNACNKNQLLIIVPCHRIVKSDGSINGFALGTDVKDYLLQLEKRNL